MLKKKITLDIKSTSLNIELDCFISIIAIVAIYFKKKYEMIFSCSWGFDFDDRRTDQWVGERLLSGYHGFERRSFNMKTYNGIEINVSDNPVFQFKMVIKELYDKKPVGIAFDGFDFPWSKIYKKYHAIQYCLIIGICEDAFVCVSPYISKKKQNLSFEVVSKIAKQTYTFRPCEPKNDKIPYFRLLNEEVSFITGLTGEKNIFNCMRSFAKALEQIELNEINKITFEEFLNTPFMMNLKNIVLHRDNFARFLRYLYTVNKDDVLLEWTSNFETYSKRWESIRLAIMKRILLSDNDFSIPSVKIKNLADCEEQLAIHIYNYTNNLFKGE